MYLFVQRLKLVLIKIFSKLSAGLYLAGFGFTPLGGLLFVAIFASSKAWKGYLRIWLSRISSGTSMSENVPPRMQGYNSSEKSSDMRYSTNFWNNSLKRKNGSLISTHSSIVRLISVLYFSIRSSWIYSRGVYIYSILEALAFHCTITFSIKAVTSSFKSAFMPSYRISLLSRVPLKPLILPWKMSTTL